MLVPYINEFNWLELCSP